jgi:hypothetical protein
MPCTQKLRSVISVGRIGRRCLSERIKIKQTKQIGVVYFSSIIKAGMIGQHEYVFILYSFESNE